MNPTARFARYGHLCGGPWGVWSGVRAGARQQGLCVHGEDEHGHDSPQDAVRQAEAAAAPGPHHHRWSVDSAVIAGRSVDRLAVVGRFVALSLLTYCLVFSLDLWGSHCQSADTNLFMISSLLLHRNVMASDARQLKTCLPLTCFHCRHHMIVYFLFFNSGSLSQESCAGQAESSDSGSSARAQDRVTPGHEPPVCWKGKHF